MGWRSFLASAAIWFVGEFLVYTSLTTAYDITWSERQTLHSLDTMFAVFGLLLLIWGILLVLRWMFRSTIGFDPIELGHPAARAFSQINPMSLALVAIATLVIGFFLSHGYNSRLGVLGSIPSMDIETGYFEIPYKWILIACLLIFFYAIWRALQQNSRQASKVE